MRSICLFATKVVLGGMFIVIFLSAGLPSTVQAADVSTATQVTDLSNQGQFAAMEKGAAETAEKQTQEGSGEKKKDCGPPDGTCNSINVGSNDPTGCTGGSKCTSEGAMCNAVPRKSCKTQGMPGNCWCSCVQ